MSNLPLKPLVWTEISEKVRNDPSICELDKGALWIAGDNLIFRYNIKDNPNSKELPFIVNYGGRQPKEVDSIEYGKHWAEHTHYASKMQPYVKPSPTWIDVDDRLPEMHKRVLIKADCYLVAARAPSTEHNKDWGITGDWMWSIVNDSWCDAHMVTHWMPIPEFSEVTR
ncbi:DUF551 domain-containing protein [Psychrobacter sp. ER1]|uniref:DUF551 domain-containing protein n=1 Tax=Psychrobacter sp. ER1 TaxID=3406645 RepID=UPI003B43375C